MSEPWMPELTEILAAIYKAEEPSEAVSALIRRAAARRAAEELDDLSTNGSWVFEIKARIKDRIAALREEAEG
jgi:hypothetical protein